MNTEESDIVWGGEAIAAAINRTRRATFNMLDQGLLPARKVGGRWVASRKRLIEALTEQTEAST